MTDNSYSGLPAPMFNLKAGGYSFDPSPAEMERSAEEARYARSVELTGYTVATFDLSLPEQAAAWQDLYARLYDKGLSGGLVVNYMDRQFVTAPTARWLVHIEYSEYKFTKTDLTDKAVQS